MSNKNILTTYAKTLNTQLNYFAPSSFIPGAEQPLEFIYAFLAKADPWPDDNDPPQPTQDQKYLKNTMKNIFAVKQITAFDISPVIHRINWSSNVIYDYYRDDIDILAKDQNGFPVYSFYVKNRYDQVFKCLWNNNGAASTFEPFFEPGAFYKNNIYQNADGYKWKYMYTVDQGSKIKFMDDTWIPVPVSLLDPSPLNLNFPAGAGNIDVINVTNGGSNYDPTNPPIITITGDGTAANGVLGTTAAAYAIVSANAITDIIVTDTGKDYTFSNVSITSSVGSGAIAIAPTSPIGGHGMQIGSDLGIQHVMYSVEFNGSENGIIPSDALYHQVGIIINPTGKSFNPPYTATPLLANGAIYSTTTNTVVASGFGAFIQDEIVYQGSTLETSTFSGTVLSFDPASNTIRLINTVGIPNINHSIYGNQSKTVRTLLAYDTPDYSVLSGNFVYLENRSEIQRSSDGIEQFKVVLGY